MMLNEEETHKPVWKYDHADATHWPEVEGADWVRAETREEAIKIIDSALTARGLRPYDVLPYDLFPCKEPIIFQIAPETDEDHRNRINKAVNRLVHATLNHHNKK